MDGRYRPYPQYKDSGIEWLGEIPSHWDVRRLKFVASVTYSNVDKHVKEDEIPVRQCNYVDVYKNEHITNALEFMEVTAKPDEIRRFGLRPGDIILTKDSEDWKDIAVPAFVSEPLDNVICGYHLALVRPASLEVEANYLFRSFQAAAINYQLQVEATGITRYGLGKRALGDALVLLPPLPEQRAIAAYLDRETARIDALIAKKRELIDLLRRQRTAVISHAVTKGLDPNIPLKDSGVEWLGEIPAHWEVFPIKYILSIPVTDGPHETPKLQEDGIPFISAEAIKNYRIDFSKKRGYISIEDHARFSRKYKPQKGDIYVVKSGATTGNVAIVDTEEEFNIWSPLAAIRPNSKVILGPFVFFSLQSLSFYYAIASGWNYGTQQNIGMGVIKNIKISVPPLPEQRAIAAYLDRETARIDRLIAEIEASIDLLQRQRTALISAAVTGKIDIREQG